MEKRVKNQKNGFWRRDRPYLLSGVVPLSRIVDIDDGTGSIREKSDAGYDGSSRRGRKNGDAAGG